MEKQRFKLTFTGRQYITLLFDKVRLCYSNFGLSFWSLKRILKLKEHYKSLFVLKRGRMPLVNMAAPARYKICFSRARAHHSLKLSTWRGLLSNRVLSGEGVFSLFLISVLFCFLFFLKCCKSYLGLIFSLSKLNYYKRFFGKCQFCLINYLSYLCTSVGSLK